MIESEFIANIQKYYDWADKNLDSSSNIYESFYTLEYEVSEQFPELDDLQTEVIASESITNFKDGWAEAQEESRSFAELNDISQSQLAGEQFEDKLAMYRNEY